MEIWDVVDRDRKHTGQTMVRGGDFPENGYHVVVHICVFNTKGEMLIQQRQPFKEGWSNLWDITVGGSAVAGDSSQVAAERELYEEIGLNLDLSHERPRLTVNFDCGFDDYYLVETEVDLDTLQLQYEEVQRVKWATKKEILGMIDQGLFIPYHKSLIELLFDMRTKHGAVQQKES